MSTKPYLIIVDGQDYIGKNYLFDNLNISWLKKYNSSKFKTVTDFSYIKNDLLEDPKHTIISRLFSSEFVYSSLYERTDYSDYLLPLYETYNVIQITLLHKDYETYLYKCDINKSDSKYSEEAFNKIQDLFIRCPYNKLNTVNLTYYLEKHFLNVNSIEVIIKDIIRNGITK